MSIIWICELCDSGTRHLSDIGIKPEHQILCRSCYENILEDVICDGNCRSLCQNMKCKTCYYKSLASDAKIFNLDFAAMQKMELKSPRFVLKKSGKKYPFICDFGHKWNIGCHKLAAGRWCPNSQCRKLKTRQTSIERFGVEHFSRADKVKEKCKQTFMKKYGVDHPMKVEEIKRKNRENSLQNRRRTCMKKYGVECALQSEKVREKSKKTLLERFGVENPLQSDEIKEKKRQTCIRKYGTENPSQAEDVKEKKKQTCMEKYGVESAFQSAEVREKYKQTCLEKYGVEHPTQTKEVREKTRQTCIEKYGVASTFQVDEIKEKSRKTCLERFGTEHPIQTEKVQEKSRQTCVEKYGVEFYSQLEESKEKSKKTCLETYGVEYPAQSEMVKQAWIEKYGVDHPMKCPEVFFKNQKSAFSRKEYSFPSGRKTQVQGYEHIALDSLIEIYDENDIQTSFENHLKIDYYIDGKKHSYYPDIFIASENLIVEVKSDYTYSKHKDINELKARACIDNGYKFQFYIIDVSESIDVQERA